MSETIMIWTISTLQILIAIGLINVWIFRFARETKYRGASAHNMKEEFSAYGLPNWFMYVVGVLKIIIAFSMILVIFVSSLLKTVSVPALGLLSLLMIGAIAMHIKVKDSLLKTTPAIFMLCVSLFTIYLISLI
jgi:hypothetical protein